MGSVVLGRLALEQRKGYGVVVKGLDFIFSATDLVYPVILLTAAWRGDRGGEAGRQVLCHFPQWPGGSELQLPTVVASGGKPHRLFLP